MTKTFLLAGMLSAGLLIISCSITLTSCRKNGKTNGSISPGNDPNFTIVANDDGMLEKCNRKIVVFGIDIYAVPKVEDANLIHAANVMAQYLDNDEDGQVDNQLILDKMLENKAFLMMWKKERDLKMNLPDGREGQDLGNDEAHPEFVANGCTGVFDAALEEILHIITHAGYATAYPDVFGEHPGTDISDAMDKARGDQFLNVPGQYPGGAWFTYDDGSCDYGCQATEYFYWALTSMLGAQEHRSGEIGNEWRLYTRSKVQETDTAIFHLLTNPEYKLPAVLPDGSYRH